MNLRKVRARCYRSSGKEIANRYTKQLYSAIHKGKSVGDLIALCAQVSMNMPGFTGRILSSESVVHPTKAKLYLKLEKDLAKQELLKRAISLGR